MLTMRSLQVQDMRRRQSRRSSMTKEAKVTCRLPLQEPCTSYEGVDCGSGPQKLKPLVETAPPTRLLGRR